MQGVEYREREWRQRPHKGKGANQLVLLVLQKVGKAQGYLVGWAVFKVANRDTPAGELLQGLECGACAHVWTSGKRMYGEGSWAAAQLLHVFSPLHRSPFHPAHLAHTSHPPKLNPPSPLPIVSLARSSLHPPARPALPPIPCSPDPTAPAHPTTVQDAGPAHRLPEPSK